MNDHRDRFQQHGCFVQVLALSQNMIVVAQYDHLPVKGQLKNLHMLMMCVCTPRSPNVVFPCVNAANHHIVLT
jgi:hypothetical protein